MSGSKTGGARPVPRQHAQSGAHSRLSARNSYVVRGQIYSRLCYPHGDHEAALKSDSVPMTADNVFDRKWGLSTQPDMSDYCLEGIELRLMLGKKVLEKGLSEPDGSFALAAPLKPKINYRLEATYNADRVYPERVTYFFKVPKLSPNPLDTSKIKVKSVHQLNVAYQSNKEKWERVDKEEFTAFLTGGAAPTLAFAGQASVVFDTHAVDVEFLSQHRGTPGVAAPMHTFTYHGQQKQIILHHLCLATCGAMILRYYGVHATVESVAEAAARFYLDVLNKRKKAPPGETLKLDPSAGNVLKFEKTGAQPHNEAAYVANGVAEMLNKSKVGQKTVEPVASERNILTAAWPTATWLMGLGWPMIVGDDLSGDYEHARVCHGIVVTSKKKIARMYVNDPYNSKRWEIKTDGSQSELGWILMCRTLKQKDLTPDRMWHCGNVPAPRREVRPP